MSEDERWVPADGSDGVIYLTYDADNVCRVHREAMRFLLARGGFMQTGQEGAAAVHPDQSSEPTTEATAAEASLILGDPLASTTTSNTSEPTTEGVGK